MVGSLPFLSSTVRAHCEPRRILYGVQARHHHLEAERITDEQLGKLRELVEKIHSCADGKSDAAAAWDAQFHQLLYEAAGNAELTRVVNDLLQTMMRLWYYLELWDKDFLSDADGAPNILKALEKRDPDLAQKAMRVHINYSVSRAVTGKFDLA